MTTSLNPTTSQGIMKLLLDMKNENRLIIIATHNPDISNQADEVINLNQLWLQSIYIFYILKLFYLICLLLGHPLQTKGALSSRGQGRLLEVESLICLFRLTSLETVVGSFRMDCPIALKVSPRSKPNWISLRSERVRCLCFVIVDLISNSNVSYLIPP